MRFWALAAMLAMAGCSSPWAVEMETPIREVPEVYLTWYQEVASCMGLERIATRDRFERIEWYSAVEIYNEADGVHAIGLWTEPHRITLRTDRLMDQMVVKHELVHDLLAVGSHPPPFFRGCAGI